ncbi:MAG: porin [Planctomycetota bacterium]
MTHRSALRGMLPWLLLLFGLVALMIPQTAAAQESSLRDAPAEAARLRVELETLRTQVTQMQEQIEALRARNNGSADRQRRDLHGATAAALRDAERRVSFLTDPATAGYDNGFFLADAEGNFRLQIGGLLQFRYLASLRDTAPAADPDDSEFGFNVARSRLNFAGHIHSPRLRYFLQTDALTDGGTAFVLDAWVDYDLDEQGVYTARVGRFKAPFLREFLISGAKPLAIDRSYLNSLLGVGRVDGAAGYANYENARVAASVNDGTGSAATDFDEDAVDVAGSARADFKLLGKWSQYDDFWAAPDEAAALFVGLAIHGELGETGDSADVADLASWTVDASYQARGWHLYGSAIGQHRNPEAGAATDQYGFLAQAGYSVTTKFQPYGRYQRFEADDNGSDVDLLTAGVNYFFNGQAARLTFDVVYLDDPIVIPAAAIGILADTEGGQVLLRAQIQLIF